MITPLSRLVEKLWDRSYLEANAPECIDVRLYGERVVCFPKVPLCIEELISEPNLIRSIAFGFPSLV